MTHRVLGVRADRVVAHGDAPPGFLVHGGPTVLWTAYLNGGDVPRGDAFRSVVRELADRAGVDPSQIERDRPVDRRSELLNDFFRLCRGEMRGQAGAPARAYLRNRGVPAEAIDQVDLGVVPPELFTKNVEAPITRIPGFCVMAVCLWVGDRWGRIPWRVVLGH